MALASALIVASPAGAAGKARLDNPSLTYLEARAAAIDGDHARSALLFAALAEADLGDTTLARKALGTAIGAGNIDLALQIARRLPPASLGTDARLLLVADDLRRGRTSRAARWLDDGTLASLSFLAPLLDAWQAAERRDLTSALTTLEQIPVNSLLGPFRNEERALILLKFRRTAEAEPFAVRAIAAAAGREARLRLALADGFLAAGDRTRAMTMVGELGDLSGEARARVARGQQSGLAIDTAARAYAEFLVALAIDVNRLNDKALPINMVRVARFADPRNSSAAVLLALLLDGQDRSVEALDVLRSVPASDPLAAQALDVQVRVLSDEKRLGEALAVAGAAANRPSAGISDFSRFGDALSALKRFGEAGDAYGRALALLSPQAPATQRWPLLLLRASALEEANRWPEAKTSLEQALTLAPEQPLILNFLGYAKLERGEDLDGAEAMIRKASALAPEEASITDSLGWAMFKRGRFDEAITTLETAAAKDPDQAEIREHLGDALFKSGRRYEARFAWSAALVTAEDDVVGRLQAKLAAGLTPANAAP